MNEKFYETLEAISATRTAMANLRTMLGEMERKKSAMRYETSTVSNFEKELRDMEEVVTQMLSIRESAMLAAICPTRRAPDAVPAGESEQ